MRNRTGNKTAPPGPARSCPPPGAHNQPDDRPGHDRPPDDDRETGLDAYVARLAAAAPPLSGQQRERVPLLLRRPRRR